MWWRDALNFSFGNVTSSSLCIPKVANDVLVQFELGGEDSHIGSSLGRSLGWDHVVNLWWLVIVIDYFIVCVVLIV